MQQTNKTNKKQSMILHDEVKNLEFKTLNNDITDNLSNLDDNIMSKISTFLNINNLKDILSMLGLEIKKHVDLFEFNNNNDAKLNPNFKSDLFLILLKLKIMNFNNNNKSLIIFIVFTIINKYLLDKKHFFEIIHDEKNSNRDIIIEPNYFIELYVEYLKIIFIHSDSLKKLSSKLFNIMNTLRKINTRGKEVFVKDVITTIKDILNSDVNIVKTNQELFEEIFKEYRIFSKNKINYPIKLNWLNCDSTSTENRLKLRLSNQTVKVRNDNNLSLLRLLDFFLKFTEDRYYNNKNTFQYTFNTFNCRYNSYAINQINTLFRTNLKIDPILLRPFMDIHYYCDYKDCCHVSNINNILNLSDHSIYNLEDSNMRCNKCNRFSSYLLTMTNVKNLVVKKEEKEKIKNYSFSFHNTMDSMKSCIVNGCKECATSNCYSSHLCNSFPNLCEEHRKDKEAHFLNTNGRFPNTKKNDELIKLHNIINYKKNILEYFINFLEKKLGNIQDSKVYIKDKISKLLESVDTIIEECDNDEYICLIFFSKIFNDILKTNINIHDLNYDIASKKMKDIFSNIFKNIYNDFKKLANNFYRYILIKRSKSNDFDQIKFSTLTKNLFINNRLPINKSKPCIIKKIFYKGNSEEEYPGVLPINNLINRKIKKNKKLSNESFLKTAHILYLKDIINKLINLQNELNNGHVSKENEYLIVNYFEDTDFNFLKEFEKFNLYVKNSKKINKKGCSIISDAITFITSRYKNMHIYLITIYIHFLIDRISTLDDALNIFIDNNTEIKNKVMLNVYKDICIKDKISIDSWLSIFDNRETFGIFKKLFDDFRDDYLDDYPQLKLDSIKVLFTGITESEITVFIVEFLLNKFHNYIDQNKIDYDELSIQKIEEKLIEHTNLTISYKNAYDDKKYDHINHNDEYDELSKKCFYELERTLEYKNIILNDEIITCKDFILNISDTQLYIKIEDLKKVAKDTFRINNIFFKALYDNILKNQNNNFHFENEKWNIKRDTVISGLNNNTIKFIKNLAKTNGNFDIIFSGRYIRGNGFSNSLKDIKLENKSSFLIIWINNLFSNIFEKIKLGDNPNNNKIKKDLTLEDLESLIFRNLIFNDKDKNKKFREIHDHRKNSRNDKSKNSISLIENPDAEYKYLNDHIKSNLQLKLKYSLIINEYLNKCFVRSIFLKIKIYMFLKITRDLINSSFSDVIISFITNWEKEQDNKKNISSNKKLKKKINCKELFEILVSNKKFIISCISYFEKDSIIKDIFDNNIMYNIMKIFDNIIEKRFIDEITIYNLVLYKLKVMIDNDCSLIDFNYLNNLINNRSNKQKKCNLQIFIKEFVNIMNNFINIFRKHNDEIKAKEELENFIEFEKYRAPYHKMKNKKGNKSWGQLGENSFYFDNRETKETFIDKKTDAERKKLRSNVFLIKSLKQNIPCDSPSIIRLNKNNFYKFLKYYSNNVSNMSVLMDMLLKQFNEDDNIHHILNLLKLKYLLFEINKKKINKSYNYIINNDFNNMINNYDLQIHGLFRIVYHFNNLSHFKNLLESFVNVLDIIRNDEKNRMLIANTHDKDKIIMKQIIEKLKNIIDEFDKIYINNSEGIKYIISKIDEDKKYNKMSPINILNLLKNDDIIKFLSKFSNKIHFLSLREIDNKKSIELIYNNLKNIDVNENNKILLNNISNFIELITIIKDGFKYEDQYEEYHMYIFLILLTILKDNVKNVIIDNNFEIYYKFMFIQNQKKDINDFNKYGMFKSLFKLWKKADHSKIKPLYNMIKQKHDNYKNNSNNLGRIVNINLQKFFTNLVKNNKLISTTNNYSKRRRFKKKVQNFDSLEIQHKNFSEYIFTLNDKIMDKIKDLIFKNNLTLEELRKKILNLVEINFKNESNKLIDFSILNNFDNDFYSKNKNLNLKIYQNNNFIGDLSIFNNVTDSDNNYNIKIVTLHYEGAMNIVFDTCRNLTIIKKYIKRIMFTILIECFRTIQCDLNSDDKNVANKSELMVSLFEELIDEYKSLSLYLKTHYRKKDNCEKTNLINELCLIEDGNFKGVEIPKKIINILRRCLLVNIKGILEKDLKNNSKQKLLNSIFDDSKANFKKLSFNENYYKCFIENFRDKLLDYKDNLNILLLLLKNETLISKLKNKIYEFLNKEIKLKVSKNKKNRKSIMNRRKRKSQNNEETDKKTKLSSMINNPSQFISICTMEITKLLGENEFSNTTVITNTLGSLIFNFLLKIQQDNINNNTKVRNLLNYIFLSESINNLIDILKENNNLRKLVFRGILYVIGDDSIKNIIVNLIKKKLGIDVYIDENNKYTNDDINMLYFIRNHKDYNIDSDLWYFINGKVNKKNMEQLVNYICNDLNTTIFHEQEILIDKILRRSFTKSNKRIDFINDFKNVSYEINKNLNIDMSKKFINCSSYDIFEILKIMLSNNYINNLLTNIIDFTNPYHNQRLNSREYINSICDDNSELTTYIKFQFEDGVQSILFLNKNIKSNKNNNFLNENKFINNAEESSASLLKFSNKTSYPINKINVVSIDRLIKVVLEHIKNENPKLKEQYDNELKILESYIKNLSKNTDTDTDKDKIFIIQKKILTIQKMLRSYDSNFDNDDEIEFIRHIYKYFDLLNNESKLLLPHSTCYNNSDHYVKDFKIDFVKNGSDSKWSSIPLNNLDEHFIISQDFYTVGHEIDYKYIYSDKYIVEKFVNYLINKIKISFFKTYPICVENIRDKFENLPSKLENIEVLKFCIDTIKNKDFEFVKELVKTLLDIESSYDDEYELSESIKNELNDSFFDCITKKNISNLPERFTALTSLKFNKINIVNILKVIKTNFLNKNNSNNQFEKERYIIFSCDSYKEVDSPDNCLVYTKENKDTTIDEFGEEEADDDNFINKKLWKKFLQRTISNRLYIKIFGKDKFANFIWKSILQDCDNDKNITISKSYEWIYFQFNKLKEKNETNEKTKPCIIFWEILLSCYCKLIHINGNKINNELKESIHTINKLFDIINGGGYDVEIHDKIEMFKYILNNKNLNPINILIKELKRDNPLSSSNLNDNKKNTKDKTFMLFLNKLKNIKNVVLNKINNNVRFMLLVLSFCNSHKDSLNDYDKISESLENFCNCNNIFHKNEKNEILNVDVSNKVLKKFKKKIIMSLDISKEKFNYSDNDLKDLLKFIKKIIIISIFDKTNLDEINNEYNNFISKGISKYYKKILDGEDSQIEEVGQNLDSKLLFESNDYKKLIDIFFNDDIFIEYLKNKILLVQNDEYSNYHIDENNLLKELRESIFQEINISNQKAFCLIANNRFLNKTIKGFYHNCTDSFDQDEDIYTGISIHSLEKDLKYGKQKNKNETFLPYVVLGMPNNIFKIYYNLLEKENDILIKQKGFYSVYVGNLLLKKYFIIFTFNDKSSIDKFYNMHNENEFLKFINDSNSTYNFEKNYVNKTNSRSVERLVSTDINDVTIVGHLTDSKILIQKYDFIVAIELFLIFDKVFQDKIYGKTSLNENMLGYKLKEYLKEVLECKSLEKDSDDKMDNYEEYFNNIYMKVFGVKRETFKNMNVSIMDKQNQSNKLIKNFLAKSGNFKNKIDNMLKEDDILNYNDNLINLAKKFDGLYLIRLDDNNHINDVGNLCFAIKNKKYITVNKVKDYIPVNEQKNSSELLVDINQKDKKIIFTLLGNSNSLQLNRYMIRRIYNIIKFKNNNFKRPIMDLYNYFYKSLNNLFQTSGFNQDLKNNWDKHTNDIDNAIEKNNVIYENILKSLDIVKNNYIEMSIQTDEKYNSKCIIKTNKDIAAIIIENFNNLFLSEEKIIIKIHNILVSLHHKWSDKINLINESKKLIINNLREIKSFLGKRYKCNAINIKTIVKITDRTKVTADDNLKNNEYKEIINRMVEEIKKVEWKKKDKKKYWGDLYIKNKNH